MHGITIEFAEFPSPHTGNNIADKVISTIQQYGLYGKIIGIVLDNASANDKAMKKISEYLKLGDSFPKPEELHIRCFAHALNIGCKGK